MDDLDLLLSEIKKDILNEPLVNEYFHLKDLVAKNEEIQALIKTMKKEQHTMCENIKNDDIYLSSKQKYEECASRLNSNPLYANYLLVKEEVINFLQEIKEVLQ